MRNSNDDRFGETRKIEPVSSRDFIGSPRSDIEIKEAGAENPAQHKRFSALKRQFLSRRGLGILAAVFVVALVSGFFLSSYYNDKKQLAENENIHQQQELKKQQEQIDEQRKELERQRRQLEEEKQALASGRNSSGEGESWVRNFIDSVTGEKEKKDVQKKAADQDFDQKIARAQARIDEINGSLSNLDSMRGKLSQVQQNVTAEYYRHKDVIDMIKNGLQQLLE